MNAYKKFGYYYDEVMGRLNYDLWLEFTEPYLKKGDNILDLACGTGTLCNMFTLEGYKATGLDLSETIIEIANEKKKVNHMDITYYVQDMTNFKIKDRFDVITCFFDSINFLKSQEDIKKMLNCVVDHLKRGGYFLCDIFSKELFKEYKYDETHEDFETFKIDWIVEQYNKSTLKHTMTITEALEEPFTEEYYEYLYDMKLINHKRLKLVKLVGDFNDDLKPQDERICMVFEKI